MMVIMTCMSHHCSHYITPHRAYPWGAVVIVAAIAWCSMRHCYLIYDGDYHMHACMQYHTLPLLDLIMHHCLVRCVM